MKQGLRGLKMGILGTLVAALLLPGTRVLADGLQTNDQVPKNIAYQGTLEKDGVGVNATVQMRFQIFDGAAAATATWEEIQPVQVYAGRFSVLLGSTAPAKLQALTTAVKAADDLYLGIAIKSGETWIALSGKQRFFPAPYAVWSTASTDLTVSSINGVKDAGILYLNTNGKGTQVGGAMSVGGVLSVYGPDITFTNNPDRGDGGVAMAHLAGDVLAVNFDGQLAGGTKVSGTKPVAKKGDGTYEGTLAVHTNGFGTLYMDSNDIDAGAPLFLNDVSKAEVKTGGVLNAGGAIRGANLNCRVEACGAVIKTAPGGTGWGSWKGWTKCPDGTYVCGLEQKVESPLGDGDDTGVNDIQILCCPF
jgi:hypothetical protein